MILALFRSQGPAPLTSLPPPRPAARSTGPPPACNRLAEVSGSAVFISHPLTSNGLASGRRSTRRAATPETNAADTEVPVSIA